MSNNENEPLLTRQQGFYGDSEHAPNVEVGLDDEDMLSYDDLERTAQNQVEKHALAIFLPDLNNFSKHELKRAREELAKHLRDDSLEDRCRKVLGDAEWDDLTSGQWDDDKQYKLFAAVKDHS